MQASDGEARRSGPTRAAVLVLALVAALGLLASGCGGGSTGSGSSGGSGNGDAAAYSACMRKNGVPDFPDPDSRGRLNIEGGRTGNGQKVGLDVESPRFKQAQRVCKRLQPSGLTPNPQEQANEQQAMLKFARCMRSNGAPNFPDPKFTPDGGAEMTIGKDVNTGSPQFAAAKAACKRFLRSSLPGETP